MPSRETLAAAIVAARIAAGLTKQEAAERTGLTRANYSNIEAGKRSMYVSTLLDIAAGLGVPVATLLADSPGCTSPADSTPAGSGSRKSQSPRRRGAEMTFTAQPYPLYIGCKQDGRLLTGRIVGWDSNAGESGAVPPDPVVVFADDEFGGYPAVRVNLVTQRKAGPFWIGDSVDEVRLATSATTSELGKRG